MASSESSGLTEKETGDLEFVGMGDVEGMEPIVAGREDAMGESLLGKAAAHR